MKKLWRFIPALPALMLSGCTVDLLNPAGPIGEGNRDMMVIEFIVMLAIVIPTCIATLMFAWKYRAGNKEAERDLNWSHSTKLEFFVWGVPIVVIAILSVINYWSTHYYDPYKPLSKDMLVKEHADVKPLTVQVVSLDWKWLFIYPEQGIATINELDVPTKTPLNFQITSDAVMTSFFIPRLGSMIYSMAGMETQLHLLAREPGHYRGEAAQYTGTGFSDMYFDTVAMPQEQFQSWVSNVQNASSSFASKDIETLDWNNYRHLAALDKAQEEAKGKEGGCSEGGHCKHVPVTYFAHIQGDLFHKIVGQYNNGMAMPIDEATGTLMKMDMPSHQAASSDAGM